MKPIEVEIGISAPPEAVFEAMTDPARMPRWLPHTEAIENPSGPIGAAGATFTQRGAPGLRRPGGTVEAEPPRSWHVRLAGFGERVDARFRLDGTAGSTRVRLEARVNNGPAFLAPVANRLARGLDRRSWSGALDRLKAEVERAPAAIHVGSVYSLDSRAGIVRLAQLLAADERYAHLRLYAQRFRKRPERSELTGLRLERPGHFAEIQPLAPTFSGALDSRPNVGWLLADGGFGLAHLPLTRAAFDDAAPVPLFDAAIADAHVVAVDDWMHRGGGVFGEAPEPSVGAYLSVVVEGHGFGIVKLLKSELRGVHVRVYSNVFAERPASIDERSLEFGAPDPVRVAAGSRSLEPFAIGHLPLSHPAFVRWKPEVVSMALVDPEELRGYEEWKLAKGGFF